MRVFRRFIVLDRAERSLLWQSWRALWAFRLGLWLLPLPRLRSLAAKSWHAASAEPNSAKSNSAKSNDANQVSPAKIGLAITRASRAVPHSTCLVQALGAQWVLGRRGWDSHLHVGVIKQQGRLGAHAWIECEGATVVGGEGLERYTPILRWENGI